MQLDIFGDLRHRAGTIQGDHGGDFADVVGTQFGDVAAHLPAFQLEHAGAFAPPQQVIGLAVVQRQLEDIDVNAVAALDIADGAGENGQVRQAQEVHLDQADLFQHVGRVARDQPDAVVGLLHGDVFHEGVGGDDDARRVDAVMAGQPFQPQGGVYQFAGLRGWSHRRP